jgi:hypothetical protein
MKRCNRCILPETYPLIQFDSNGVCNICGQFTPYHSLGHQELREIVDRYRKPTGYDCIVALSGGRDSTYALYYVVVKLGLRPLAVTCDNGFMPEQIRENISHCVKILNVDHINYIFNYTIRNFASFLSCWTMLPDPAIVSFLCNGCMTGITNGLTRIARDNNISLIIGGGGEPEKSFAEPLLGIGGGLLNRQLSLLCGTIVRLVRNPSLLLRFPVLLSFCREAYYRFYYKRSRDLAYPYIFHYISWDEQTILNTIEKQLNWRKPNHSPTTWRADCDIHLLKQYVYRETLGFTKNDELLSSMVRRNMLGRQDALRRLEKDNDIPLDFLAALLSKHGINFSELSKGLTRWRKRHVRI